jgi:virulence-associated protein VagC
MKAATIDRVRIFTSGNSQAIRLPKKFRIPGQTAHVKRQGRSLLITPEEDFQRAQPDATDHRRSIFP